MGLLTIGAFARAARLTPKALRLYDELGVLPPAAVDPESGYRLYDRQQLPHARLIGQLRQIGMPLAEIRTVLDLAPTEAAAAVSAYWRQVTADTAERARLTTLLVEHLSGRDTTMSEAKTTLDVHYATGCERGLVRETNQDAAYASDRLLAVADGGGPGGDAASAAVIDAVRALEQADVPGVELLGRLAGAVADADRAIRAAAADDDEPISTLTAMVRRDTQLALVHIGDTRVYLLREGELSQLTHDHTWVQSQVDAGKFTLAEAAAHPQRALLVRAVGAGGQQVEADLALRTVQAGDRYLLCSDGLYAVLGHAALHTALTAGDGPAQTVQKLLELVQAEGAPDNVACVVADLVAS